MLAKEASIRPELQAEEVECGSELTLQQWGQWISKNNLNVVSDGDDKELYDFGASILTRTHSPARCGIVLAGGEGKRLQPFIDRLRGDGLPKQYTSFIGSRSMLEHTFQRAEKLISSDLLFTVVNRDHLRFPDVRRQLSSRPQGSVVVQPENKETGPGLLLPLIHLYQHHPESTVVVFPSDHFIVEEDLFMVHVELAFRVVERNPSRLVLLGMEPSGVESAYGYILPVQRVESVLPLCVREVSQFIEKPKRPSVRELMLKGALWNTMVMVFKAETLLDLVRRAAPTLYRFFNSISETIGTAGETDAVGEAYKQLEPVNFSQELLEPLSLQRPSPLWVLPVRGVHWSDWGSESRIMSALQKTGHLGRLNGISTKQGLQDKEPSAGWRNRPRSKWLRPRGPKSCLGNLVKEEHSPDPEGVLIDLNRRQETRRILTTLSPKEEKIIRMRFGIGEKTEYTLEETGKVLGVTRERIRQIEAAALRKLRQPQRIVTLKAVTATDT